ARSGFRFSLIWMLLSLTVGKPASEVRAAAVWEMAKKGRVGRLYPLSPQIMPDIPLVQARAAIPAGSSVSAFGRQSIDTKPEICSTRRNQVRTAGKVERS